MMSVRVSRTKAALRFHHLWFGSSGSVVARRLAENPDVSVLLLEAGGTDDVPNVIIGERAGEMLKADHKL